MNRQKTFLITGVSSGIGAALSRSALDSGNHVVGTVRNKADAKNFEDLDNKRAHARIFDVTDEDSSDTLVSNIEATVGPIDVLVCNAGYGHEGTFEESTMSQLRHQFEVNVFGAVAVTKSVLPFMRHRRSGHIIGISSMGGIVGFPGISFYNGSKFALEGIFEALGKEVSSFGIHVTSVEPGAFRTDWSGRSMVRSARSIIDYDPIFDPIRNRRKDGQGAQPGDPAKAAKAILKIVASGRPPRHLLLGTDALRIVRDAQDCFNSEVKDWQEVSASTDFEEE